MMPSKIYGNLYDFHSSLETIVNIIQTCSYGAMIAPLLAVSIWILMVQLLHHKNNDSYVTCVEMKKLISPQKVISARRHYQARNT